MFRRTFPGWVGQLEIGGFQPYLIAYFPRGELPRRLFGHDLTSDFMGGEGFLSSGFKGGETVL